MSDETSRTLVDIIEGARDGVKPTYDECYLAMLVLDSLLTFERSAIRRLLDPKRRALAEKHPKLFGVEHVHEESFRRCKAAFEKPPREWLGEHNIPGHPEQVKWRRTAKAMLSEVERRLEQRDEEQT